MKGNHVRISLIKSVFLLAIHADITNKSCILILAQKENYSKFHLKD